MWNFLGTWFLTLEFSKWHTILQNFQGWNLVFSGICKGKVANLKIPEGGFQKRISTTQPVWSFSGIVQLTGEFHPKSQVTILVARQLKLFKKKIPNRGRVGARFPTGVKSMGGLYPPTPPPLALQNLMVGLESMHGESMVDLKRCRKVAGYKPASLQILTMNFFMHIFQWF